MCFPVKKKKIVGFPGFFSGYGMNPSLTVTGGPFMLFSLVRLSVVLSSRRACLSFILHPMHNGLVPSSESFPVLPRLIPPPSLKIPFCLYILSIVEDHWRRLAWSLQLQRAILFWNRQHHSAFELIPSLEEYTKNWEVGEREKWLCPMYSLVSESYTVYMYHLFRKENFNIFSKLFLKIASYYCLLCLFPHIT